MSESIYIMMKSKEKILYAKGLASIGKWNYKTFIKYDYYINPPIPRKNNKPNR